MKTMNDYKLALAIAEIMAFTLYKGGVSKKFFDIEKEKKLFVLLKSKNFKSIIKSELWFHHMILASQNSQVEERTNQLKECFPEEMSKVLMEVEKFNDFKKEFGSEILFCNLPVSENFCLKEEWEEAGKEAKNLFQIYKKTINHGGIICMCRPGTVDKINKKIKVNPETHIVFLANEFN